MKGKVGGEGEEVAPPIPLKKKTSERQCAENNYLVYMCYVLVFM